MLLFTIIFIGMFNLHLYHCFHFFSKRLCYREQYKRYKDFKNVYIDLFFLYISKFSLSYVNKFILAILILNSYTLFTYWKKIFFTQFWGKHLCHERRKDVKHTQLIFTKCQCIETSPTKIEPMNQNALVTKCLYPDNKKNLKLLYCHTQDLLKKVYYRCYSPQDV